MISQSSRSREWIYGIRAMNPGIDPNLLEKMIMAFILVEDLQTSGLNFTFKGGTALALILRRVQRFSIDIDIVTDEGTEVIPRLAEVIRLGSFTRFEVDIRRSDIPKAHYKIYYHSQLTDHENSILLDVLLESNPYPLLQEVDIQSPILNIEGNPSRVNCPACECLLGDKLSAFAPHTTGIRYNQGKELEIIKQLFDIASLFDVVERIDVIDESHRIISSREIEYRDLKGVTRHHVLMDALDTAMVIGMRSTIQNGEYQELASGISKLKGYVLSGSFSMEKAILCSSKLAYLVSLLLSNNRVISRFSPGFDLAPASISSIQYNKLNKLKKTNLEAFHYFYQTIMNLNL